MRKSPLFFICIYVLFRWFFMPIEHTGDGWGYACEVLKGDLFAPHHILQKPLLFLILKCTNFCHLNIEPIVLFSGLNLIFSGLVLCVFYLILNHLSQYQQLNFWLLFLAAFTFGFVRYSSENETYIIPLFLSLLGSYLHLKKNYLGGYFFLSLAVLFHQMHVFWLIAFFIPQKNKKNNLKYFVGSLLFIVSIYVSYAQLYHKNWYSLPFNDVNEGLVDTTPGIMNFILTPISFVRTFIQIHGDMNFLLFQSNIKWIFWGILMMCTSIFAINLKKFKSITQKLFKLSTYRNLNFQSPFFYAFLFHFVFAFYSVGNAEFMVMTPFLLILWLHPNIEKLSLIFIHYMGMLLLVWNAAFYIIPMKFIEFHRFSNKHKIITNFCAKVGIRDLTYVTENHVPFSNYLEYLNLTNKTSLEYDVISKIEFSHRIDKCVNIFIVEENKEIQGTNRASITKQGTEIEISPCSKKTFLGESLYLYN